MTENIPLYGSHNSTYSQSTYSDTIGKRNYELTNHLGNVLSVISDKVIPHSNGSGGVDYFLADIRQSTDYSAFGVQLEGRNLPKFKPGTTTPIPNADGRFGFNGMEKDDEIKGDGNSYDFGARMLDPRLGRWFCVDPLNQFVASQYLAFANNPILLVDIDGKWVPKVMDDGRIYVEAEEGDNYESLMNFFGGKENAMDYLEAYYFGTKGSQTKITTGTQIFFNKTNVYSEAMTDVAKHPEKYVEEDLGKNPPENAQETYNCHSAGILGTKGESFINSEGIENNVEIIKNEFKKVSSDDAVFGETLITHGDAHSSVFFGQDKSGNNYTFTKNGYFYKPEIIKVKDNVENHRLEYGPVRDINVPNPVYDPKKEKVGARGRLFTEKNGVRTPKGGEGYYNPKKTNK